MAQYIKKSDIIAEIERRRRDWWFGSSIEAKYKREECDDILSILDTLEMKEVEDNKCSDCTNSKGCINCEGGNMKVVKMKEPEGALKELLDNIDPIEYEKTRREMLKRTIKKDKNQLELGL